MPSRTSTSTSATFDLGSCHKVIGKLEREIGRATKDTHREDLADHCTNAAWTAWHLVEHVWADIKSDWNLKAALAKDAGIPLRDFDLEAFKAFVLSEHQCPNLAYCRIIATESKHVGADRHTGDPNFFVYASAMTNGLHSPSGLDWLLISDVGDRPLWVFKFVEGADIDGADRSNAVKLFRGVLDYWKQFIDTYGVSSR